MSPGPCVSTRAFTQSCSTQGTGSAMGQGGLWGPQGLDPTMSTLPTCWGETWVLPEHPHLCWQHLPDHSWEKVQGPSLMGSTSLGVKGRSGDFPHRRPRED